MRVIMAEIKRGQIFACMQYPADRFSYITDTESAHVDIESFGVWSYNNA